MPENGRERPKVNLSCIQCQQRKKKCDKGQPCQACKQNDLECVTVSRPRLPRGRHASAKSAADLKQRVARLESLLAAGDEKARSNGAAHKPVHNEIETRNTAWTAIGEEVLGIRELLDVQQPDEEPVAGLPESSDTPMVEARVCDMILYSDASCFVEPNILSPPPKALTFALLDIYLHRVDPVLKAIHRPTLRTLLLGRPNASLAQEALKSAVYFTALCTLDETECLEIVGLEKITAVTKFRLGAEIMLSRAGLLTARDLTALQAFVVYLTGLRTCNGGRSVRALIAMAISIGSSLRLDTGSDRFSPFETQMRRRIWYAISILDLQTAFDGGSYPSLAGDALFSDPPLHIDDSDISPGDDILAGPRFEFTDMTFSSMTHEMLHYMRRLAHVPVDYAGRPMQTQEWSERYSLVDEVTQVLQDKYLKYCNTANVFHRFTRIVGENMLILMRLLVRRPLHRFYSTGPPPKDDFDILDVALDVLDRALRKYDTDDFSPWRWFTWIKWYALAVLLAELCEHTIGPRVERAWIIAEAAFTKYEAVIDDDLVLGSTRKLMHRARLIRSSSLRSQVSDACNRTLGYGTADDAQSTNGPIRYPDEQANAPMQGLEESTQLERLEEEMETQSWFNWEAFVQDIGDSSQLDLTEKWP